MSNWINPSQMDYYLLDPPWTSLEDLGGPDNRPILKRMFSIYGLYLNSPDPDDIEFVFDEYHRFPLYSAFIKYIDEIYYKIPAVELGWMDGEVHREFELEIYQHTVMVTITEFEEDVYE